MSNTNNIQTVSEILAELHECVAVDLIDLGHQQQVEIIERAGKDGTEAFVSALIFHLPMHLRLAAANAWAV